MSIAHAVTSRARAPQTVAARWRQPAVRSSRSRDHLPSSRASERRRTARYDIGIIQIPAVIAICVITAPSGLLALAGGWSRPPRFSRRCCAGRPCARSVSGRQAAVDLRARAAGRPRRARVLGNGAAAPDAAVRHEATYQRHPQTTEPRHALPPGVVLTAIAAALPLGPVRIPRACARLATTPCCWRRPPAPPARRRCARPRRCPPSARRCMRPGTPASSSAARASASRTRGLAAALRAGFSRRAAVQAERRG